MNTETKINYTVRAVTAVLTVLILLGVIHLTAEQIAGIGLAISTVMLAVQAWFDPKMPVGKTE